MASNRKKKILVAGTAALLVAGVAGGGALITAQSTISGNRFEAVKPAASTPPAGSHLVLSGTPIDHTFDGTTFDEQVEATWTLQNDGNADAIYTGALTPRTVDATSDGLAQQLEVDYSLDGNQWAPAGHLDAPMELGAALKDAGIIPDGLSEAKGGSSEVHVRIRLSDPRNLPGADLDHLKVNAQFAVDYMDAPSAH